jgi:ribosomal protein S1
VESLESVTKPGDEVTAKIIKIERGPQKINLSRRSHIADEERQEVEKYKKTSPIKATTSLGNLLKDLDIKVNR